MGSAKWWIIGSASVLGILFLFSLAIAISVGSAGVSSGNIAHIELRGVIMSESENSFLGGTVDGADAIVASIKRADENPRIDGILLDINSPGGSAVASEEIVRALEETDKPVVALIRDVGASGAYWAASASDEIVASPLSITGSVGATASYLEFSGLFERYGVGYERVVSGQFKDAGTPFRDQTAQEEALFQEMISETGNYFANSVQQHRGLNDAQMQEVRTARIFLGSHAKELGLVDTLGNIDTAKESLKSHTGSEEINLVSYSRKNSFSFGNFASSLGSSFGSGFSSGLVEQRATISLT